MFFFSRFINIFFVVIAVQISCSSVHQPITKNTTVETKTNALIIIGVIWKERFFDLDQKKIMQTTSENILEKRLIYQEDRDDIDYLSKYYINNLKLEVATDNDDFIVEKFNNNSSSYQKYQIYQVNDAHRLQLIKFTQMVQTFFSQDNKEEIKLWNRNTLHYNLPTEFVWQVQNGKIYYLGDIIVEYETEKFRYSSFNKQLLNKEIKLRFLSWKNQFEPLKQWLKEYKAWFPQENIVNLAQEKEWSMVDDQWISGRIKQPRTENNEDDVKVIDEIKKIKKEGYFF